MKKVILAVVILVLSSSVAFAADFNYSDKATKALFEMFFLEKPKAFMNHLSFHNIIAKVAEVPVVEAPKVPEVQQQAPAPVPEYTPAPVENPVLKAEEKKAVKKTKKAKKAKKAKKSKKAKKAKENKDVNAAPAEPKAAETKTENK